MAEKKRNSQSIRNRLIFMLVFLSVVTSINYSAIVYYDLALAEIEKTTDVVGYNRTLSQQITLFALLSKTNNSDYKKILKDAIEKHYYNLRLLRNGGIINQTEIAAAPTQLIAIIDLTERTWSKFQEKAEIVVNEPIYIDSLAYVNTKKEKDSISTPVLVKGKMLNPKVDDAIDYLVKNNTAMLDRNKELTEAFLNYFDEQQISRGYILLLILGLNIVLIIIGFAFINIFIANPIAKISRINNIVSEGDFTKKIDYDKNDELGRVAESINTLFENLKTATDFVVAIGEGRLNIDFEMNRNGNGQFKKDRLSTALLEMRDRMGYVAEQDRQRSWVAEGLAMFADILRKNPDQEDFTYRIISNLVKYMGANQGALFIVEDNGEDDAYLELLAAYAFERKKYLDKKIQKGEGLVGEVFQEGQTIYVTEVPEEYINITSGLGDANPKSILIVPLKLTNDVYGVVELASFEEFKPYKIEFVEKLSESIATTFASVKTNSKTQKLLLESVQLSEQMRAQEEEMRQNLEELISTQEEVQRKNVLIEQQKTELQNALNEQMLKTEMLQAQEEQMKQGMDVLQDTQKELERKNKLVLEQKRELEERLEEQKKKNMELQEIQNELAKKSELIEQQRMDIEQTLAKQVFKNEALKTREDELMRINKSVEELSERDKLIIKELTEEIQILKVQMDILKR